MVPVAEQADEPARLVRTDTGLTTESNDSGMGGIQLDVDGKLDGKKVEDDEDAAFEVDELADAKPRKKRKIIKNGDKKYQCPHPDCGKSYSRAEHLYRHQLNREWHAACKDGRSGSRTMG